MERGRYAEALTHLGDEDKLLYEVWVGRATQSSGVLDHVDYQGDLHSWREETTRESIGEQRWGDTGVWRTGSR